MLHSFGVPEEYPQATSNIPRFCRSFVQNRRPEPCWDVGDETCSDVVPLGHLEKTLSSTQNGIYKKNVSVSTVETSQQSNKSMLHIRSLATGTV